MNGAAAGARVGLGSRLFVWLLPSVLLPLALAPEQRALAVLIYDAVVAVAFVLDARRLARAELRLSREAPRQTELGRPLRYTLTLENCAGEPLWLELADDGDPVLPRLAHVALWLAPGSEQRLHTTLEPRARGVCRLGPAYVHVESRLGLARAVQELGASHELRVLPPRAAPEPLAPSLRRALGELTRGRSRGPRSAQLAGCRAFVPGDPPSSLDQRKSARHGRPIVRTYEREHDDTLWLVLDTGRSMLRASDSPTRPALLERGIDAVLAVAGTALREGRAVGFMAFAGGLGTLLPPARGRARLDGLREVLAGLIASPAPLDAGALYELLAQRLSGRCQVVLVTALHADALVEPLSQFSRALTKRHDLYVLVVGDALARGDAQEDVYLQAARHDLAAAEAARLHAIGRAGASVLYFEDAPRSSPSGAPAERQ